MNDWDNKSKELLDCLSQLQKIIIIIHSYFDQNRE